MYFYSRTLNKENWRKPCRRWRLICAMIGGSLYDVHHKMIVLGVTIHIRDQWIFGVKYSLDDLDAVEQFLPNYQFMCISWLTCEMKSYCYRVIASEVTC
jgi:hypothetical protein